MDTSSAAFLRFLLSRMTTERLARRRDGPHGRPGRPPAGAAAGRRARSAALGPAGRPRPVRRGEVAEYLASWTRRATRPAARSPTRSSGGPAATRTSCDPRGRLARTGSGRGVPRLADLLIGRLDRLPDPVRDGRAVRCRPAQPVPDRLLRRVAGLADAALDAAVREAVAEGVLIPDGAGYAFAHDLFRSAVRDDLLPGERARLHAGRAAAPSGCGGPVRAAEMAHHVAEAGDAPQVLTWSVRAGEEAMRVWAPDEARHHLERALAAWPRSATPPGPRAHRRDGSRCGRPVRRGSPANRRGPSSGTSGDPAVRRRRETARGRAGARVTGAAARRGRRLRPGGRPGGGGRRLAAATGSTPSRGVRPRRAGPGPARGPRASEAREPCRAGPDGGPGGRLGRARGGGAHDARRSSTRSTATSRAPRPGSVTPCGSPGPRVSRLRSCVRTTHLPLCTTTTATSRARCRCCGQRWRG